MSELLQLSDFLKKRLVKDLPGKSSHNKMIPAARLAEFYPIPENARMSSVLLLLFENANEINTILIQRPEYNGVHSSQISFPGGSYNDEDTMLENTALRETEEEIGLDRSKINIVGSLTELYIPPSNFRVKPYVGYCTDKFELSPDKHEVQNIIFASVNDLVGDKNIRSKNIQIKSGKEFETRYYDIKGLVVWGATAMIIREFAELYEEFIRIG